MKREYWMCLIGPTDGPSLKQGADFPMRMAVMEAFEKVTGHENEVCASGWGISYEKYELLRECDAMEAEELKALLKKRKKKRG